LEPHLLHFLEELGPADEKMRNFLGALLDMDR